MLSRQGFQVTASDDSNMFLGKNLDQFDGIVDFSTEREITAEQEKDLLQKIIKCPENPERRATLYLGIHAVTTCFHSSSMLQRMIGARFLTHPPMQNIKVKVEIPSHPILEKLSDFDIEDELYLQEYYPPFRTLLSTDYRGFKIPLAWVKNYGCGLVAYLALGHGLQQIENPNFQMLISSMLEYWRRNF